VNVPKLRFKEFDGEWRRYNLSSIVNLLGGNAFSSADSVSEGIKWLKIANVGFGKVMWNNKDFLPYSFQSQYAKYLLEEEDIVLTLTRPILNGKLKIASLNKRDTPSLLNQRVAKIEVKNDITSKEFLFHLLQNRRTVLDIEKSISGTDPPNLGNKELKKIEVDIPFLEEGNKVAVFLNKLSEKIQLQQQKIDLLQEQKKGYMQKIFNQGLFQGEWEEVLLGNIVDIKSGRDYKHLAEGDVPVYGTGGYMLSVNEFLSESDAVGIGRKGSIDKPQLLKAPFWTVDTLFYCIPKGEQNLDFIHLVFQNINWKKYDESTGVPSLSKNTIKNIKVLKPDLKKQKQIGEFFKNLDKEIALEQQKLELLKKQKQGFMQQMFI